MRCVEIQPTRTKTLMPYSPNDISHVIYGFTWSTEHIPLSTEVKYNFFQRGVINLGTGR